MSSAEAGSIQQRPSGTRSRSNGLRVFCNALISILTLLLLVYAGYGETLLTYKKLEQEQISAQAGVVRSSIENALISGIPLDDIAGLERLIQSSLQGREAVTSVTVVDVGGRQVFPLDAEGRLRDMSSMAMDDGSDSMMENDAVIAFGLPLQGRFETEGYLQVELSKPFIEELVRQIFYPLFVITLILVALSLPASWLLSRSKLPRFWREQGWFTLSFSFMSLVLVLVLTGLYIQSAGHRVERINDSLQARLSAADSHGIPLSMLSGVDELLEEYQQLNPGLDSITLSRDAVVRYSSDPDLLRTQLERDFYQLSDRSTLNNSNLQLVTTMPFSEVVLQVLRAGRNFTILYLTTLLLSLLFNRLVNLPSRTRAQANGLLADRSLEILKPLFFIAVFMESLHTALLPELLNSAAETAGLGTSLTSLLFMLYFLSFALMLLPGNRLCQRFGNRAVMLCGLFLAAAGSFLLALAFSAGSTLELVALARLLAGIGQSLLMVGVQNEILDNTTPSNRTTGASVIVTSFNGGFICGTALGALLASYVGATGVFVISGLSGVMALVMTRVLVSPGKTGGEPEVTGTSSLTEMKVLLAHRGFAGTMLFVGLPAKATLTGIVTFSLPLVMSQAGYASEDIGQIIICYAIAVLASTRLLSSWVDQQGNTRRVLYIAMLTSAVAILIASAGLMLTAEKDTLYGAGVLLAGVLLLGLSHGGINAPVVSHVTDIVDERTASRQTTVTFYRFLERFGHVLGPLLAGQVMVLTASGQQALLWMAGGLAVFALAFYFSSRQKQNKNLAPVRLEEAL
ncbi:MFS transporter [Endozoicomonadaceae bacterium StTr2]